MLEDTMFKNKKTTMQLLWVVSNVHYLDHLWYIYLDQSAIKTTLFLSQSAKFNINFTKLHVFLTTCTSM